MVIFSPPLMSMYGFTFHPLPRSCAGYHEFAVLRLPVSSLGSALPPFPLAPVKFSGLIDLVFASDNLERLPMFMSSPLNWVCCANVGMEQAMTKMVNKFFMMKRFRNLIL